MCSVSMMSTSRSLVPQIVGCHTIESETGYYSNESVRPKRRVNCPVQIITQMEWKRFLVITRLNVVELFMNYGRILRSQFNELKMDD